MNTNRNAQSGRLRHDYKAHVRAIQISNRRVFAYCEGRSHDPYVYSEMVRKAQPKGDPIFEVYRVEEITGTGGKAALNRLFKHIRKHKLLISNFKGKAFFCAFFMDKDIDDVKRTKLRSGYVFYTKLYDLESHIFCDTDLCRAIAVSLSIPVDMVPVVYSRPYLWIESKSVSWEHWIILCIFCTMYGLDCGCGYNRASQINAAMLGPSDLAEFQRFKFQLGQISGVSNHEFARRFAKIEKIVQKLRAKGELSSVFKGKWLEAIMTAELQRHFHGKQVVLNSIGPRVSSAAMALHNFDSVWASTHVARLSQLISQVI
jgi:hypothetical protein